MHAPAKYRPETRLVHAGQLRSQFGETSETLYLTQSYVYENAAAAEAREVLPQAQIQLIDDCGHLPMIERPDEFLGVLLPFLDRAEAAAAA